VGRRESPSRPAFGKLSGDRPEVGGIRRRPAGGGTPEPAGAGGMTDIARRLEGESGLILVAESGISESVQVRELADAGFDGFLVGSAFMDTQDPGRALGELLDGIK